MYDELVKRLRELQILTEHCDEQSCLECKNRELCDKYDNKTLSGTYKEAADAIEELRGALLLMVLQYCTTDDGVLYHSFMSVGENAFAVLGLENGLQADPLWDRLLPLKEQAEEGE